MIWLTVNNGEGAAIVLAMAGLLGVIIALGWLAVVGWMLLHEFMEGSRDSGSDG